MIQVQQSGRVSLFYKEIKADLFEKHTKHIKYTRNIKHI